MNAIRLTWYRFRATLPRRWSGYLALTLLIGLVGGGGWHGTGTRSA